jgi:hypothetical protein
LAALEQEMVVALEEARVRTDRMFLGLKQEVLYLEELGLRKRV